MSPISLKSNKLFRLSDICIGVKSAFVLVDLQIVMDRTFHYIALCLNDDIEKEIL